jgi:GNAT superfamily N-acetyltransferase
MGIPKIEIRRAQPEEADAAFALVEEYFALIGVVARENRQQFVNEYFGERRGLWLARVDAKLAGCVGLRELRCPEHCENSGVKCAEIKRMYVREAFRGQGAAHSLLAAVEAFARTAGYDWIYLDTTQEMKAAARLYERSGFSRCERYNQNPQAAIFMRKNLRTNS